jgi:sugar phosphate isomerase/epimerase
VQAGFDNAELWTDPAVLENGEAVARLCCEYPLSWAVHFPNRSNLTEAHLRQAVDLCRALDVSALVIHQPQFDRYGAELARRDPELKLAVENHRLDPAEFRAWAQLNPGLTLDVEHLWMFTHPEAQIASLLIEIRRFLDEFGEKLRHVHLPGHWPGLGEHRPMYCARDMVLPVLTLLDEYDFAGLVVSEADTPFQNETELRMDVLLFDTWRQMSPNHRPASSRA